MKKPLLSWSNLSTFLIGIFIVLMLFVPEFKALFIQGLMKVGLFQPNISKQATGAGDVAEDIAFQSSDRKVVHLEELKGKVVFLNFWATWCPPCIAEMPSINELHQRLKNNTNVVFIMVDVDHDLVRSQKFMAKHQLSLPLYQPFNAVSGKLFSGTLPTTVVINKQGQIVFRHEGGADYSNFEVFDRINNLSKVK